MSAQQTTISLAPAELERLLRRVVREELNRRLGSPPGGVGEDWTHEGPEDPEGDRELLGEAIAVMEEHASDPEAWSTWEDFERELDEAEARGELPR